MKRIIFLPVFLLFTYSIFGQDLVSAPKYEYAFLIINPNPFKPRTLEIFHADGQVEKFADLKTNDIGKNFYLNLQVLLKAFNHLGSQGYELVNIPDDPEKKPGIENQYVFKRKLNDL